MAYPTVSKPYGLQPINLIGGQVFAGATRYRRIASGYATAIFYGDLVKLTTDGTVVLANETSTGPSTGFAGVFLGCTYTDPTSNQVRFQQYYPGSITPATGTFINAVIADDPDTLFKVVVVSSGVTVTGIQYSAIGENADLVQQAGSTITGNSLVAVNATTGTARTKPIRIVDVIPDTAYESGGNVIFPEVIVKINAPSVDTDGVPSGGHMYNNPLGIA
jgi:hypothetical protein